MIPNTTAAISPGARCDLAPTPWLSPSPAVGNTVIIDDEVKEGASKGIAVLEGVGVGVGVGTEPDTDDGARFGAAAETDRLAVLAGPGIGTSIAT